MSKTLTFTAKTATVTPNDYRLVEVEVVTTDIDSILDQFSVMEILTHKNDDLFLHEIGKAACMEYFDLKEND